MKLFFSIIIFVCIFLCIQNLLLLPSIAQTIDNHIKVDQFGYLPAAQKICVISNPITGYNAGQIFVPSTSYKVRRVWDSTTVYTANITTWKNGITHTQSGDKIWWFDFSAVTQSGKYYIYDSILNKRSYEFEISPFVYNDALKTSQRTFYYQRCGVAKDSIYAEDKWKDGTCHNHTNQFTNCKLVTNPQQSNARNLSGGWHDAGDYNKYVNFALEPVRDLLLAYQENPNAWSDDYNIPESGNGIPDVLDEIKFELDWLLKMQDTSSGAVLTKAGTDFLSGSPPSADLNPDYYGAASTTATFAAAAIFAHAAKVLQPFFPSYAITLQAAAIKSYNWAVANPNVQFVNTGCTNVSSEYYNDFTYGKLYTQLSAACFLYDLTGNTTYRTFFNNNYNNIHLMAWTFAYPFEAGHQDVLLYYTKIAGATSTVKTNILNTYKTAMTTNGADNLPSFLDSSDAYRSFMQSYDYTWGNNQNKCDKGGMFLNMNKYNLDTVNKINYKNAAQGFLNYIHGINPQAKVYLTNMYNHGAENCVNEFYNGWFHDGTPYDNALTSPKGPAPGFMPGGANPNYAPDGSYGGTISPPQNQPTQKCYKDWNTGWPQNSWEISENAIYSQAAYSRLVCDFVRVKCATSISINGALSTCISNSDVYSVSAGIAGTTYLWEVVGGVITSGINTNTITVLWNVIAGNGTITVYKQANENACIETATITVAKVNTVAITNNGSATICVGQGQSRTFTATVYAGANYQWKRNNVNIANATNNTYTTSSSGNYKVLVTLASGCTRVSNTIAMKAAKPPASSIGTTNGTNICGGTAVSLVCTNSAQTGLTFQWKKDGNNINAATANNYSATTSGSYQLITTNTSFCSRTSPTIAVTQSIAPIITPAGTINFCNGDSVLLSTTNSIGAAYQWKRNNVDLAGAVSSAYYAKQAGTYKVTVTDGAACTLTSATVQLNINCKNGMGFSNNNFQVSPNPFSKEVIITSDKEFVVNVFDMQGKLIEIFRTLPGLESAIGGTYTKGMYMLQYFDGNQFQQIKIVKSGQ